MKSPMRSGIEVRVGNLVTVAMVVIRRHQLAAAQPHRAMLLDQPPFSTKPPVMPAMQQGPPSGPSNQDRQEPLPVQRLCNTWFLLQIFFAYRLHKTDNLAGQPG